MTAEEYIINKLEEYEALCTLANTRIETQEKKIHHLECIIDTLKKHANLEGGSVWIHIGAFEGEDREIIVKALGLKEEETTNE